MTGFSPPRLCVICDADACDHHGWTPLAFASACLDGGARFLQIRAKHLSSADLLALTMAVVERASHVGALVVVNDRADIARMAGAAGVHVGQDDLSPSAARAVVGPDAIVGMSTHTVEQAASAVAHAVSYIAVGPVFGTATKDTGYEAVGLELVERAAALAKAARLPLVAIGGITRANAEQVIGRGAASVAIISDLFATGDPRSRVHDLVTHLDACGSTA